MVSRYGSSSGYLFMAALVVSWQITASRGLLPIPSFPTALQVGAVVGADLSTLLMQLGHTIRRACTGLALGIIVAIPLGIAIARIRVLGDLLEPVIEFLRPLPTPAIIPVVMLIAGIGDEAKIAVIFYGALFPILLNSIDGVKGLDPMLSMTAAALRLNRREAFFLVFLPAALPQIFAGIRVSVGISFMVAITSEMLLSTDGIGIYLLESQQRFQVANGLAAIIVVAIAAWAINRMYLCLENRLLHWHKANAAGVQS